MLGLKLSHVSKASTLKEQGNSEGFDSCDWPSNLTQIEFKSSIFRHVWPLNLMDDHAKQWYTCSMLYQALCNVSKPSVNFNWSYTPETPILGQYRFFVPWDLVIRRMALKNNRAHFLFYFKLCASFHSHWWIQTGITVRKQPNRAKIGIFLSCVTVKFDGWSWKTLGHLFYAILSSVHHSIVIAEFKLELQSGNVQIGTKFVLTSVTLTFDLWPWPFAWISLSSMDIIPEKNHDDTMTGTLWKKVWQSDGQTDGRTERSVAAKKQLYN